MHAFGTWVKIYSNPRQKYFLSAVDGLLKDIEATFEKYIWPKSCLFTKAQDNIMAKVLSDVKRMVQNMEVRPPMLNFSQRLRLALKSLKEDPNIIIAKADKGDTVVVMDSEHYYGLAIKHLVLKQFGC